MEYVTRPRGARGPGSRPTGFNVWERKKIELYGVDCANGEIEFAVRGRRPVAKTKFRMRLRSLIFDAKERVARLETEPAQCPSNRALGTRLARARTELVALEARLDGCAAR